MKYLGTIIEESLEDSSVLSGVKITKTVVKTATKKEQTPWVKQWTLHTVEVPEQRADVSAKMISLALDRKHERSWYADFKNDKVHYIIFRNKFFCIDRTKPEAYQEATAYGLTLGIPDYQLDFSSHILVSPVAS